MLKVLNVLKCFAECSAVGRPIGEEKIIDRVLRSLRLVDIRCTLDRKRWFPHRSDSATVPVRHKSNGAELDCGRLISIDFVFLKIVIQSHVGLEVWRRPHGPFDAGTSPGE
jgi:hypothetical protein